MRTLGAWKILGASALLMTAAIACGGGSSTDDELPSGEGAGGSAGSTAGKGGSSTAGKGGTGGTAAGAGGSTAGTGGGTAGKGGATGGTGGSTAGSGGSTAGSGGSTAGTGGTAGKGGATGGTGGSTAGTGGTAGKGGATGGTGGGTAGKGGATGGTGGSTAGSGGSTAGSGGSTAGAGGGTAGSGGNCGPFGCGTGGTAGSAGSGGGTTACTKTDPSVDADGDGYFPPADCNDCDPNVNPGALDIINTDVNGATVPSDQQVDEDCSGTAAQPGDPTTCDTGLALDSAVAMDGAKAMDLCKQATDNPKTWGVIEAKYQQIDGAALPAAGALGHGIEATWGSAVKTKLGANMLVLSSGAARLPGQADYDAPSGGSRNNYDSANPPGVPFPFQGCTGAPEPGPLKDSIELQLKLRVPTNAKSFSYNFKFYTYEFPTFTCSTYNDFYITRMSPLPAGIEQKWQMLGNISFDATGQPLSVNNALLDVCKPQTAGGKNFPCPAGEAELDGTGYEGHGATSWLQTTAPVTGGDEITLRFAVTDAGDAILASTVLLDNFQFSANPGKVQTGNACKLGGTGACLSCNQSATSSSGCCSKEITDCYADPECAQIAGCKGFCGGSIDCEKGCYAQHPAGQPEYDKVLACLYNTVETVPCTEATQVKDCPDSGLCDLQTMKCALDSTKNKGACGVSCGLQTPLSGQPRSCTTGGRFGHVRVGLWPFVHEAPEACAACFAAAQRSPAYQTTGMALVALSQQSTVVGAVWAHASIPLDAILSALPTFAMASGEAMVWLPIFPQQ